MRSLRFRPQRQPQDKNALNIFIDNHSVFAEVFYFTKKKIQNQKNTVHIGLYERAHIHFYI
jgi:hypothetical protein